MCMYIDASIYIYIYYKRELRTFTFSSRIIGANGYRMILIRVICINKTINEYKILVGKPHGKEQLTNDKKRFEGANC